MGISVDFFMETPVVEALVLRIVDVLKTKVSEFKYNQWLRPARFSIDGDSLRIDVPNKFIRDWILDHYLPLIRYEMFSLSQREFKIAISVSENAADTQGAARDSSAAFSAKAEVNALVQGLTCTPAPDASGARAVVVSNAYPQGAAKDGRLPVSASVRRTTGLNGKYTFESFVVGSGSQFCHAAALAVAEHPGRTYNPLLIYGGVGLGKTHLLNAIGLRILATSPQLRVLSITGEQFTNELINAIRYETTYEFRKKYREGCDVLLIDDVQFIAGKERTQEEFFHTFNTLYESRRQIVLTSDRSPKDMAQLEERLRSRFNWGLIADIQTPDTETRIAILRRRAESIGVFLPDDVAQLMAEKIRTNIRDLEGAFTRLSAFAHLYKCALSTDLVRKILQDIVDEQSTLLSFDRIQALVAAHFKVAVGDLKSAKRYRTIAEPRQIAMYLCKKYLKASFPEIGHHFGGKDHSTVIHAVRKIEKGIGENPAMHESILQLEKSLSA